MTKITHTHPAAIAINQIEGEPGTFSGLAVQLGTVNTIGEMINPRARVDLDGITVPLLDSHNEDWSTALGALGAAGVAVRDDGWVTVNGPFLRTQAAQQARDDLAEQLDAGIKIEMSIGYSVRVRRYAFDGELTAEEINTGARVVDDEIDAREVSIAIAGRYPDTELTAVNCAQCGEPVVEDKTEDRHSGGVSRCATVGAVGAGMLALARRRADRSRR